MTTTWQILEGDARHRLSEMPSESVHCVVTSPPYWGLRDYGAEGQIGLEPSFAAWLSDVVRVFAEVRRVLRKDGTVWVNMGDAYAGGAGGSGEMSKKQATNAGSYHRGRASGEGVTGPPPECKPKDLIGQPWRLAFALQTQGWYLRSDIIWAKPNPMPESVTDRPTKAHEYVFLLSKSRTYFYDADAVREAGKDWGPRDRSSSKYSSEEFRAAGQSPHRGLTDGDATAGRNLRDVWTIATEPFSGVASYGSYRIGLPDCRAHGHRAYLARALECGELRVSSDPPRNLGKRGRPDQGLEGVAYAIRENQFSSLSGWSSAIAHSNEIRRMAAALEQDGTCADRLVSGIESKESSAHSASISYRTSGSNTSADGASGGTAKDPSGRNQGHILGIATFRDPPRDCTCKYLGKVEMRQDHYASFPTALVEPCIKAGTSEKGVCPECGAPWLRVVERGELQGTDRGGNYAGREIDSGVRKNPGIPGLSHERKEAGFRPFCDHGHDPVPATVLDPFAGSGTTLLVALQLQRSAIGIELNPAYADMARRRIRAAGPLFYPQMEVTHAQNDRRRTDCFLPREGGGCGAAAGDTDDAGVAGAGEGAEVDWESSCPGRSADGT